MEKRTDPVQIMGLTGGVVPRPEDFERALDLWCYKAGKEGWAVTIVERQADAGDAGRCGTVEVEGLRYEVRYGPRTRIIAYDDGTGTEVARPMFAYAVWVEPVVSSTSF